MLKKITLLICLLYPALTWPTEQNQPLNAEQTRAIQKIGHALLASRNHQARQRQQETATERQQLAQLKTHLQQTQNSLIDNGPESSEYQQALSSARQLLSTLIDNTEQSFWNNLLPGNDNPKKRAQTNRNNIYQKVLKKLTKLEQKPIAQQNKVLTKLISNITPTQLTRAPVKNPTPTIISNSTLNKAQ